MKTKLHSKYNKLDSRFFYISEHGGSDINGEWYGNGNLYTYIDNVRHGIKHNYEVEFDKNYYERGYDLRIYICLNCCNSKNFTLLQCSKFLTLEEAKWFAVEFIREYEQSDRFEKEIIPELNKKYTPVFRVHQDHEVEHVGDTIFGVCQDWQRRGSYNQWRYYYDEKRFPRLNFGTYYTVDPKTGDITYTQLGGSSITTGPFNPKTDEEFQLMGDLLINYKLKLYEL